MTPTIWDTLPILLLALQNFGFGKSMPWSLLPFGLGRLFWGGMTVALLVWMIKPSWPKPQAVLRLASQRAVLVAWLGFNFVDLAFSYVHFKGIGYQFPVLQVVVLLAALPLVRLDRLWASFAISLALLAASIVHFPILLGRSDMLPVIQSGLDRWWSGTDPYATVVLAGRENVMGYLPGTLFSHLPAWWMNLDLRWNSIFFRMIWMGGVLKAIRRRGLAPEHPAVVALHYFALSPYFNFRHDLYFEIFLVWITAYVFLPRLRCLWIPLLVVTRQWAWVLAPFLCVLEVFPAGGFSGKRLAQLLAGFLGILGGTVALLHSTTSLASFHQSIFWFQGILDRAGFPGDYGVSFSPGFFRLGIAPWTQKFQGLACLGIFAGALVASRRHLGRAEWGLHWQRSAYVAWIVFLLLNMHYWLYFWISVTLFGILVEMQGDADGFLGT